MFCRFCIGSGIVTGLGEYRGVCPECDGVDRQRMEIKEQLAIIQQRTKTARHQNDKNDSPTDSLI